MQFKIWLCTWAITIFCTAISHSLLSQSSSYQLSGKVIDKDNGQELEGTFVILKQTNDTKVTDEHGRFTFLNLEEGQHQIIIRHVGCRDTSINITVKKNTSITIKLPHSAVELSQIDVMDKQLETPKTQHIDELSGKELDKTRGQNLGDALQSINGVTTLKTGSSISKPMIHGMQGYRVLILNNGIRQEGQQWGNEHAPEIDPFIAQRLTVVMGSNAVRYGSDAIAGVILVEPNNLPDTASIRSELNLVGSSNGRSGTASAIIEGYFDKLKYFSWRLQGTLKKSGNVRTPNYYLKNTGVEENNFSWATSYHRKRWGVELFYSQFNSKIGIFSGAHADNLTDLMASFNAHKPQDSLADFSYSISRPYQLISHELAKMKWHWHIASRWVASFQYAYQYNIRKEFDKHPPLNNTLAALNKPELDYRITSQSGELMLEHLNIKSFRGQLGASYVNQQNVYLGRFFIPNYINNTFGVFAIERFVRQHIELEAGLRYDYKNLKSFYYIGQQLQKPELYFSNLSWNAGGIIKPNKQWLIVVNVGSAWRAPAVNELYSDGIHQGLGSIEKGNSHLKTEKVYNFSIASLWQLQNLKTELNIYHNQFENYIYLNPSNQTELTIQGAYPVFIYQQAQARISGIDAKVSSQFSKHLEFNCKAMLLRGWNYTINDYLIYMPSDRYSLNTKYFTDVNTFIRDTYFEIGYQYITKQWRVPKQSDFAPPPQAYGLLNAEIGTSIILSKQRIDISLLASNILNTVYRDYLDRFRYFTDAIGRNYTIRIKVPLTIYDKK
ncbi:MAG: TonB-dependent receptor [Bacteroidia bacterium]|nr:TonB-dependent receptor [Bacteroidia bacterium]